MPFKKSAKINDWAMNPGVEGEDSANDYQGQTWQFRVAIHPTKTNLEKALNVLNGFALFKGQNHPTAKLIQFETTDLTAWDGTLADASDRDQRGKELCVYLPYNSATQKFLFDQAYIKNLMLDIWKALQDAEVEISYITPKQDEKELSSDPTVLTPFCYSSFKPYSAPEGILHSDNYNPNGHPDPLEGLHFSKADLKRKGITKFDALTISQSRVQYMQSHYQSAIQHLNETIEAFISRAKPSSYLSLKNRINQAFTSDDDAVISDLLSDLQQTYANFYKSYPTQFNKGARFPILEEGYIKHLLKNCATEEKKAALMKLQKDADQIIQLLQECLIIQNWPLEKPDETVIRDLASRYPFELQAIQHQLVHLNHEVSAIDRENLRCRELQNLMPQHNSQTSRVKIAFRAGGIAGAIGLAIGASLGVALLLTGIFAPYGVGGLGILALSAITGVGAGVLSGGFFCALAFKKRSKETVETFSRDPQPVVESRLNQGSYKILSKLTKRSSNCTDEPQGKREIDVGEVAENLRNFRTVFKQKPSAIDMRLAPRASTALGSNGTSQPT